MTEQERRDRASRRRMGRAPDGRWILRPVTNPRTLRANANRRKRRKA